jgi:hypothetical protein
MLCWHRDYNLGDEHGYDCDDWKRQLVCEDDDDLEEVIDIIDNELYEAHRDYAEEVLGMEWSDCAAYACNTCDSLRNDIVDEALDAAYVVLPLTLYDHGGITMRVGSRGCPRAEKCLRAEVEVYDQYLTGDVYGFIVEELVCERCDTWEETDSCWGFFGSDVRDNGMADHLGDELTALAESVEPEYPSY